MIYLLLAIGLAFVLQLAVPGFTEAFWLDPSYPEQVWRIVTSIFLHANAEHIFFNALSLFFFAPVLERMLGKNELYKIFFIGGIAGNALYLALSLSGISPPIPALGASGAIYAILGAVAYFQPESVVYLYFFPLRMKYAVVLWVLLNLFYITPLGAASGIGGAAHLGGLFFGLLYAKNLKDKMYPPEWQHIY